MAASFDPAELSRVGGALTWALQLGIPEHLPRLLSIGGMLHGAAETSTIDNPLVSFFVGLNLSSLVDLAGGGLSERWAYGFCVAVGKIIDFRAQRAYA